MEKDAKKNVDEFWKEAMAQEKEGAVRKEGSPQLPPEPNFSFFVSTFALQASIFLGEIPNPANDKKEKDLPQAKFIIDTLGMLKEKTANNLSPEESALLENALYELRMQYVNALKKEQKNA